MSRRHPQAMAGDARAQRPSRRLILAGATSATLTSVSTAAEPIASAGRLWLVRRQQIEELSLLWGRLEHELTTGILVESAVSGRAAQLDAIERQIQGLHSENEILLAKLHRLCATTLAGVLAKLEIAAVEIDADDHPVVHRLIVSTIEDVQRIGG